MACVDTDMVTGNHMEDGMGDLFDHIEDLLDFPSDDEDALGGLVEPCDQSGTLLLPLSVPVDGGLLGGVGGDSLHGSTNQNDKAGTALNPEEDNLGPCDELEIVQLEWMSRFFDDSDSFSLDLPSCDDNSQTKAKDQPFFRTSSPVPILEANTMEGGGGSGSCYDSLSSFSSSSTSASYFDGGNNARATLPLLSPPEPRSALVIPARARSRRARPAIFSPLPHVTVPYLPPSSDVIPVHQHSAANSSDLESFGETCPSPPPLKKKKNKTKSSPDEDENGSPRPVRKCMHCEIQKTPQWRAGPMGPKTLCNACGVRYKSGRLFPEYRPAASPTFVPSLHSNSHKKVVKMRMKAGQKTAAAGAIVSSSDGCDLLDSIRRWE